MENLFSCEGQPGHEIVLLFDAVFTDRTLYEQPLLQGHEAGAVVEAFTAEWKTLDELTAGNVRLVPETLISFLSDYGEDL